MKHSPVRIAFIGGGNMARALLDCLLRAGTRAENLAVGEPVPANRERLHQDLGIRVDADNAVAIAGAEVVVLAVKPQQCAAVLAPLSPVLQAGKPLLLSIAAGIQVMQLQHLCPGLPVVRVMPNRPALVGAGVSGLFAPPTVTAANRQQAEHLMGAAGRTVWLNRESDLDLVTALSGSGPAYFFLMAEQMAEAAIASGLDPDTARTLAAETLYGAGQLAHDNGDLAAQRQAVTSKGGTTEAALHVFASAGLGAIVTRAMQAAADRSAELASGAPVIQSPKGTAWPH